MGFRELDPKSVSVIGNYHIERPVPFRIYIRKHIGSGFGVHMVESLQGQFTPAPETFLWA
jgi:hypothetical protein